MHSRSTDPGSMTRRSFLRAGTLGGLAAAVGGTTASMAAVAASASGARADTTDHGGAPAVRAPHADLEEMPLTELQARMQSGHLTARALTAAYLARIEALDRRGPALHSIIETNPEALAIASQLDAERKAGHVRGPLHGIPVLVKDNIATADRMKTTAGSLALEDAVVPRDAFIVGRLRAAGAIILGKTNLSEWANFRSSQSSSGWSARGGQCRNPYVTDRSPCGSSSGTGAAIAASLAAVGVGSETDGSIVCPAGMCSLVGIKPTLGLVSRAGIIPIAHSQDTAGPMARTVADAAALLTVLAFPDDHDSATIASVDRERIDYTKFLDPNGLAGARIGVVRKKFFGYSPEADALVQQALDAMQRLGAVLVDPVEIPHLGEYDDDELTVLLYEFKTDLEAYLADLGPKSPMRTLADLIAFNERHKDREMRFFGQDLFEKAQEKGPLTDQAYRDALAKCQRLARTEGLEAALTAQKLDALVGPTGSPAWPIDLINGDHFLGASSSPAAVAGCASITVPVGYSFGLPVGMSLIGASWSEGTLIRLAYAFEQAMKPRRKPRFLATLDDA